MNCDDNKERKKRIEQRQKQKQKEKNRAKTKTETRDSVSSNLKPDFLVKTVIVCRC